MKEAYDSLKKNPANYIPLTPISFLSRTADIYGEREAIIYGNRRYKWKESNERCLRMASSLSKKGINIMTEKPMATRWNDGINMVKACDQAGVRLFVVKQNRNNPTIIYETVSASS